MLFNPDLVSNDPRDLMHCRHHTLERFRRSPKDFYDYHIAKILPPEETNQAMRLGTAVDSFLLTNGDFYKNVTVMDDKLTKSTSKASMKLKDEIKAKYDCQGKAWLTRAEFNRVDMMAKSALENAEVVALLEAKHEAQKQVFWECPYEGWPKRGTIDYLGDEIIDLKTTSPWNMRSKRALSDWIYQSGYHRQLAFYQEGILMTTGVRQPCQLIFIGNDAPYETVVVNVGPRELEVGHEENRLTCKELADCCAYNNFPQRMTSFDVEFPDWVYGPR